MNHSETVIKEHRRKRLQMVLAIGIAGPLITVCGVAFLNKRFSRPPETRVSNGRLADCPDSPNCVSSVDAEASHAMQPFQFTGTPDLAWRHLLEVVSTMQRCHVVVAENDYIHCEFTTPVFGFVDDVEFLLNRDSSVIHFRSAARVGYSDLGVNRSRMSEIRQRFETASGSVD